MRKLTLFILFTALVFSAACCAAPQVGAPPSGPSQTVETSPVASAPVISRSPEDLKKYMVTASLESECLKNNLIKAPVKRNLYIYLPPTYFGSSKSYPVVYYLHGHGQPAGRYIRNNRGELDGAFIAGAKEFIFVGIEGGPSYYVNSPVSGNWEDYFLTEIIPYVDENYRTIPDVSSRGICGFSMGGFGSINLALKHPDIFCAVYSMSPGLLKSDGLPEAMETWIGDRGFLTDYARAFAPNTNAKSLGDVPQLDGTEEDNIIVEKWMSGFGNLEEKMQAYIALNLPLKAIAFSCGTKDGYTWIPKGTQYFSDLLNENGIKNSLLTFDGGHAHPPNGITEVLVPFFNENLTYED